MKYYLGIDQGGTKTLVAACGDDGVILGCQEGGASIFYLDDPDNISTRTAYRLSEDILNSTGLTVSDISAVCAGLTGADWDSEYPIHEERTRKGLGISDAIVLNDCMIALRAGSSEPNRAIICAGTGLNIAVSTSDGREIIYGYYITERMQGARALGNSVVDAVVDAEAGVGPVTSLKEIVLEATGYNCFNKFLEHITTRKYSIHPKHFVIGLLKQAHAGDLAAVKIVNDFAVDLAKYIVAGFSKLHLDDADVELVYSGSVFKNVGNIITDRVSKLLSDRFPRLRFKKARYEPVCGALLTLLDRHYSGAIPDLVMENFDKSCVKYGLLRDM